jgi:hypothetical protein
MHLNLKAKFALLTGAMVLAVGGILTTFLTRQQEKTIRDELMTRAVALTEGLAYNCQLPLAAENKPSLGRLAQGMFKQAEVSYVQFLTSDSTEMYLQQDEGMTWPFEVVDSLDVRELEGGTRTAWLSTPAGSTYVDVRVPVVVEGAEDGDILATGRRAENVYLGEVRVGLRPSLPLALISAGASLGRAAGSGDRGGGRDSGRDLRARSDAAAVATHGRQPACRTRRLQPAASVRPATSSAASPVLQPDGGRDPALARAGGKLYLASLRSNAEHLEEANRALQQSNGELAKASRMKSEFLAVMSHELRRRSMSFSVLGSASRSDVRGAEPEAVALHRKHPPGQPAPAGSHQRHLDLSKVEAGRMKVALEPVRSQALDQ